MRRVDPGVFPATPGLSLRTRLARATGFKFRLGRYHFECYPFSPSLYVTKEISSKRGQMIFMWCTTTKGWVNPKRKWRVP